MEDRRNGVMRDSDWWIRECLIASCWVLWKVECGFSSGHAGSGYSVGGTVCVSVCVCVDRKSVV